ncbi:hypothetical protein QTL86_02935 [Cellulosilyticum sp. ST5]|uniref:hypothetical protein n=1 Tax=Cellulosilyticum sp. ST5 TaxID=3055805 RepID=UPI0039776732
MLIYYTINEYIKEWKEDDIIACPPKSIPTRIGYMSKNEIDTRIEYEARIRGESDRIRPPSFLSKEAKRLFKGMVYYLIPSGSLKEKCYE